jgi:hypothetical protein
MGIEKSCTEIVETALSVFAYKNEVVQLQNGFAQDSLAKTDQRPDLWPRWHVNC